MWWWSCVWLDAGAWLLGAAWPDAAAWLLGAAWLDAAPWLVAEARAFGEAAGGLVETSIPTL
jgi:hypothetical protein